MKFFFFRFDQAGQAPSGGAPRGRGVLARAQVVPALAPDRQATPADLADAAEAAVAAGYALLCTHGPEQSGQRAFLPCLALPAAEWLERLLARGTADAESLPERWDAAAPAEAEALVADLLATRMDAWAATVALEAALPLAGLDEALEGVEASLGLFDHALAERADFLATLADTRVLAEWRLALVEAHRHPYPWWLAGILEATAVEVERSIAGFGDVLGEAAADGDRGARRCDRIRAAIEQAGLVHGGSHRESPPAPLAAWRSPDGGLIAWLLLPSSLEGDPPRGFVVEFHRISEAADLARLRGGVVVLGTIGEPIEWRGGEGGVEVAATFARQSLFDALAEGDAAALSLHVKPGGGAWSLVDPD